MLWTLWVSSELVTSEIQDKMTWDVGMRVLSLVHESSALAFINLGYQDKAPALIIICILLLMAKLKEQTYLGVLVLPSLPEINTRNQRWYIIYTAGISIYTHPDACAHMQYTHTHTQTYPEIYVALWWISPSFFQSKFSSLQIYQAHLPF